MNTSSVGRRLAPPVLFAAMLAIALVPGAVTAGNDDCAMCHEQITKSFEATEHGRIAAFETMDGVTGCVTCHGDGAEHIDNDGDPDKIGRFTADTGVDQVAEVCSSCHRSGSLHDWEGSTHELNGVGCADCHQVHATEMSADDGISVCLNCHTDVRAQFEYPSHHPLREGHMDCQSCHTPHGGSIGMVKNEERPAELCLTCHTYYSGPFLFEHEPVSEGCDTCHSPHGAVANNLLVQNEPFLCLQCHETHFHAGLEGEPDAEVYVPRFDPLYGATDGNTYPGGMVPNPFGESGYRRAFTTKCSQCHTQVHGTDSPSQAISGQGQGLMR